MAARALAAAAIGRRAARETRPPLLASCRNRSASAQRVEEAAAPAMTTGEQVEAALNTKNVEVLQGEEHVATVLPDETIDIDIGAGEDASWVPDQETGVFVPADADTTATHGPPGDMPTAGGSVLDQAVFLREEEMEDVERPAVDMANGNDCSEKY
ncbi:uncharacterized protein LOC124703867 [Lolium rigidum]|uniref:uncharacterized protein LOC124703867 n=1 Tax=Lolium rigidum TaxID=89674 RepID=UPI001F5D7410|nr:uncharacterized protein LOC124703867 [Lolium rigidum]